MKDHAFGISMAFRHEKNFNKIMKLKNTNLIYPIYYCNNGIIKAINFTEGNNIFITGDCSLIKVLNIEDQNITFSLIKDFIFEEILDYKLFISKNFDEIKKIIIIIV